MVEPKEEFTNFGFQKVPFNEKTSKVEAVFQSVAERYDIMNDLMSFGLHRLWKKRAISRLQVQPHYQVLDLACGTGDLTCAIHKYLNHRGAVFGADINSAMLKIARKRVIELNIFQSVRFIEANAECLPFETNSFNAAIIGFGLRNFTNIRASLNELYRVLQPGSRLVILEFSKPHPSIKPFFEAYSFNVLPKLGKIILKDSESYQYLAESIKLHPNQEELIALMEKSGFERCSYENLSGGISAIHVGYKI